MFKDDALPGWNFDPPTPSNCLECATTLPAFLPERVNTRIVIPKPG
jgi:hypothetical protein